MATRKPHIPKTLPERHLAGYSKARRAGAFAHQITTRTGLIFLEPVKGTSQIQRLSYIHRSGKHLEIASITRFHATGPNRQKRAFVVFDGRKWSSPSAERSFRRREAREREAAERAIPRVKKALFGPQKVK